MKTDVTYLQVPYSQKDKAKNLGAWWDAKEKLWFVPKGTEISPFLQWVPQNPEVKLQVND